MSRPAVPSAALAALAILVGLPAPATASTSPQTIPTQLERVFAPDNAKLDIDGIDDHRVDVDVAVLDAGVRLDHPDLDVVAGADCEDASAPSYTCSTGPGAGDDEWTHGHGTGVSERLAAIDNGIERTGGVGVGAAPGARIWAVDVVYSPDLFNPLLEAYDNWDNQEPWEAVPVNLEPWIAGVRWVTAHADEIEVMHIAVFCTDDPDPNLPQLVCIDDDGQIEAFMDAIDAAIEAGVVVVGPAGNWGREISGPASDSIPASHPDIITTSAIFDSDGQPGGTGPTGDPCTRFFVTAETDDRRASTSHYGAGIDVAAPGPCTSGAAPFASGAAAILASRAKPQDRSDVLDIRDTIVAEGNSGWTDDSGDGVTEPLVDLSEQSVFDPVMRPGLDGQDGVVSLDAISVASGVIDLYARGSGNNLKHKRFHHGWTGWTDLGGAIHSRPVVMNRYGDETVNLFATDSLDRLVMRWYHPTVDWSSWSSPGPTAARGVDAASPYPDTISLHLVNGSGDLLSAWWTDSGGWSSLTSSNALQLTSPPSSISRDPGYINSVGVNTAGDVYHRWYGPGSGWSAWSSIGAPAGLDIVGTPSLGSRVSGDLDVFARASDGALWRKSWVDATSQWTAWTSLSGTWTSTPAVVSARPDEITVFGIDGSGNVHSRTQKASGWSNWVPAR